MRLERRLERLEEKVGPEAGEPGSDPLQEFRPRIREIVGRWRKSLSAGGFIWGPRMDGRFLLRAPSYSPPWRRQLWPLHEDEELARDLGALLADVFAELRRNDPTTGKTLKRLAKRSREITEGRSDGFVNFPGMGRPWRDILFALFDEKDAECWDLVARLLPALGGKEE